MTTTDNGQPSNLRYPERPDGDTRIVHSLPNANSLFRGWGPKLVASALAIGALTLSHKPAMAATHVAVTSSCTSADHGAALLSYPDFQTPDGVGAGGQATVRVNLAATGRVDSAMIEQSSGNFDLDFAAIRVAMQSRYVPASIDCNPANDTVLYNVTFDNW